MAVKIAVLTGYFAMVMTIGLMARKQWRATPESYFLADRALGTFVLLGTMVATNFSAFTVFGASGAGYRDGFAFFPIMGFGTGFMALTFWILGRKISHIGRALNLVTPPELIKHLYQDKIVAFLFASVMIVFTLPYLALQPMAAGYVLESLVGLPYRWGAVLVTGVITLYTLRGGMRAVAWTDVFQGILMVALLIVSFWLVADHHGGFITAGNKILASRPELFSRPGGEGMYTVGIWFSYMMLWFLCDPMFPQLFQRFYAAGNSRVIAVGMIFYPLVCTVVFFLPVVIGMMGRLSFPALAGKEADRILPLVISSISGDAMAALVMAAGLGALMSTMDSQLLTLSSIITRDIIPKKKGAENRQAAQGRMVVLLLSAAGLALALKPPATILQIATQTFTGLAVLFPTVIFGLYLNRRFAISAVVSIIAGESAVAAFYLDLIPAGPFLPIVWVAAVSFGGYMIPQLILLRREGIFRLRVPVFIKNPFFYIFSGIFVLSIDFWAWGLSSPLLLGLPLWLPYFILLSAGQTIAMILLVKRSED
ncbi:MAG: sodium:solute symporter family protein [Desulfatiglandaceae bacterium]